MGYFISRPCTAEKNMTLQKKLSSSINKIETMTLHPLE